MVIQRGSLWRIPSGALIEVLSSNHSSRVTATYINPDGGRKPAYRAQVAFSRSFFERFAQRYVVPGSEPALTTPRLTSAP
jgi:hypothetical protein